MKHHLSIFVAIFGALSMAGFAPAGGEKDKKTEVEGAWKLTKGGKGAPKQITFLGSNFVLTFDEDRVFKGTFKLNTTENPSWMDMTIQSGPEEKYKDKVILCIYSFDSEFLNWCATAPGSKRRPQQFVEVMGDARLFLGAFEKDKK